MCGRFVLHKNFPGHAILEGLPDLDFEPRYNIAPTQLVALVRWVDARPRWARLRWGLVPPWAQDLSGGSKCINARSETLLEKRTFRAAFRERRCLVPATGFFEWKKGGRERQPYLVSRRDGEPFCFAGLWEAWRGEAGEVETFTIVTTEANTELRKLHERMPVLLQPDQRNAWLTSPSVEELNELMRPSPPGELQLVPVSRAVNNVKNDSPRCIEARADPELPFG